ncbi:MAG: MFS transporter [Pseudomonadota bacterium]
MSESGKETSAIPRRAFAILALLFVFQTLNFFDKLAFGVSGVPMMREFGLTPSQFGLIGSVFFIFFAVGGAIIGLSVVGRYPSKIILLSLAAVWTVSQFPIAFTSSIPVIVGCRLLLGVGEGAALATAMTAAYEWFPADRRYIPSALILQGLSAGFLIGGPLLTFFVVHVGWRSSFLVCGLLSLVWILLYAAVGKEGPLAGSKIPPAGATSEVPQTAIWFDPTVIGVILLAGLGYWVIGMSAVWLPPYLRLGLGYDATTAGWIISAIYLVQSPLLLLGSWITQSLHKSGLSARMCLGWSSGIAMLVSGVALVGAVLISKGAMQIGLLAIAFSTPSLTTIFIPVILSTIAPARERGRLIVVILAGTSVTAFFSTYSNGWIVGKFPHNAPTGFAIAFGLGGAILLLGALTSFLLLHPERTLVRFDRIRRGMDTGSSRASGSAASEQRALDRIEAAAPAASPTVPEF